MTGKKVKLALLGILILFCLGLTSLAEAKGPGLAQVGPIPKIKMEAKAGMDGYFRDSQWLPVQITLTSDDLSVPVIKGRLELSYTNFASDDQLYQREVELVAPYRKTYWLYMMGPRTPVRSVQVRLVNNAGQVLADAQKDVTSIDLTSLLVGVVSDDTSALNYLNGVELIQPYRNSSALLYSYNSGSNQPIISRVRTVVAHLSPTDLPPAIGALGQLDVLVIGDLNASNFVTSGLDGEEVRNRIGGWLASGRALVVAGDTGLRKASPLTALLPVALGGNPRAANDLSGFNDFISRAKLTAPTELLPSNATAADVKLESAAGAISLIPAQSGTGSLMLASRGYGLGQSWFLAVELGQLPNWKGAENFWKAIFKDYQPRLDYATLTRRIPQGLGPDWGNRITPNPEARTAADPWSLMIFLGIYILLIGPVLYFVLKRYDKRELAWIIVPALSVLFTGGAYLYSIGGISREIIQSRVAVVVMGQGNDRQLSGATTGLATLYSNRRSQFDLNVTDNVLFYPTMGDYSNNNYSNYNSPNVPKQIKQGAGAGYRDVFLGIDQHQSYSFEEAATNLAGGGIQADAKLVNGKLTGTLENRSSRTWEEVALFIPGNSVQKIGTIKAGEKISIPAESVPVGKNIIQTLVNSSSNLITSNGSYPSNYPLGLAIYRKQDGKMVPDPDYHRAVMLESLFGLGGEGLINDNNRFYLIGWSPNSNLPFNISIANADTYDLTLLFQGLTAGQ